MLRRHIISYGDCMLIFYFGVVMTIEQFFDKNRKVAIAFSGGVDSAYLLYEAVKCKADVKAYYVRSQFQPQFEYEDALRLADEIGADMSVIDVDVLSFDAIVCNPSNRCYYCKQQIFGNILEHAKRDGYTVILDGTNASDEEGDRPGMKALKEMEVKSPLRECGLTKDMIRALSKEAGLFTWDKPAYACLATRIATGETITKEKLQATEVSEMYLANLGFTDFRVRRVGDTAKLQFKRNQIEDAFAQEEKIKTELMKYYSEVIIDTGVIR